MIATEFAKGLKTSEVLNQMKAVFKKYDCNSAQYKPVISAQII